MSVRSSVGWLVGGSVTLSSAGAGRDKRRAAIRAYEFVVYYGGVDVFALLPLLWLFLLMLY